MDSILTLLAKVAREKPFDRAVVETCGVDYSGRQAYTHLTFSELDNLSSKMAEGFKNYGITKGTKTALMVTPGLDFAALTFGLFKAGAIVVMIDPGMGIKNLGKCLEAAGPEAFVGIPKAHAARVILRWAPKTIKKLVTVGRRYFWGGKTLAEIADTPCKTADTPCKTADEALADSAGLTGSSDPVKELIEDFDALAAILFTSGSTGVAKGVEYTHKVFASQVAYLRETFKFADRDVDLATFPLFALFDPVLGITTVIPDMDSSRPASADPKKLIQAINDNGCTQMFGSPALIDNLSRYGEKQDIQLKSMKRVISAGAPARPDVLKRLAKMLGKCGEIHTPYGATESLPVSSISSNEILSDTWKETVIGGGTCVGKPCNSVDVYVIKITDSPVEKWSDELKVEDGEKGEIVVCGPVVTKKYYNNEKQTQLAKILDDEGRVYHRMGDIGRFDEKGRLWFCGRKSHRVQGTDKTFFSVPCEAVFNVHNKIFRSALVGLGDKGNEEPLICVELEKNCSMSLSEENAFFKELEDIASSFSHTKEIKKFLIHPSFPVDVRHNAKINREILKGWAKEELQ